ncbi:MAG: hypothetical protein A2W23_01895 [Planctomycetes bacterium RBG_16_43_13]|nr:MAG: hypothetical protein A2W23_01895 [Planctomycetes bacterium RBG_16_43_13]
MRKKIVFLLPYLLLVFLIQEVKSWMPPLEIDVVSITFDFEAGYADDALYIRKNASTYIAKPEWLPPSRNNPLAYIKSQANRHIYVSFTHNQGAGEICFMVVKANGGGYYPGTIQETYVSFPSCGTTASAELTLTGGSTPSYVQKWGFSLYWYVTEVNDQPQDPNLSLGTTGSHLYYTLLAAPQSPMSEPWTDVLDYSCVWAVNQSTALGAASAITNSLFNSGFNYDVAGGGAAHYGNWAQFNLGTFLSHLGSSNLVNCLDMGKAVTTFGNAIGCAFGLASYGYTYPGEYPIDGPLNCIDPIGTPAPTNNPFGSPLIRNDCGRTGFSYHAFAEREPNPDAWYVWDATLKYDMDTDPDNVTGSNPGCGTTTSGHSMILPANHLEGAYVERLIDPWPIWYQQTPTLRRNRSFSVQ